MQQSPFSIFHLHLFKQTVPNMYVLSGNIYMYRQQDKWLCLPFSGRGGGKVKPVTKMSIYPHCSSFSLITWSLSACRGSFFVRQNVHWYEEEKWCKKSGVPRKKPFHFPIKATKKGIKKPKESQYSFFWEG